VTALRKPAFWLAFVSLGAVAAFLVVVLPNYRVFLVHTGSMTPTIPIGSAVVVDKGPVRLGEVITFHRQGDGRLVTHRLVRIDSDGLLVTKGDGNATDDPGSIPRSNVVGHVVAAPRYAGTWINFLFHSSLGFVFDGLILLIMFLALAKPARKGSHRGGRSSLPASEILARKQDFTIDFAETAVMTSADIDELDQLLNR
jgi:signal peptidase I